MDNLKPIKIVVNLKHFYVCKKTVHQCVSCCLTVSFLCTVLYRVS